jgi:hypothetical protein
MLNDSLDGAAFPRRISPFEDDNHLQPLRNYLFLHSGKLHL